jgi:glycosyltransferase involved in cell wall biosynthesis
MSSQSNNPIFTVVIPLIPQHDFEIKRILKLLANEQYLIERVIICRSETKGSESRIKKKYQQYAKSIGFKKEIVVNSVKHVARDGTNRNRGWQLATTKYVAFMDADDLYSETRLSTLLRFFDLTGADALLHNYSSLDSPNETNSQIKCENTKIVLEKDEAGMDYLSDTEGNVLKIHFAHITVRNDIKDFLMFTDRFPGADWEFATQLVSRGLNVQYLTQELSAWSRNRSIRYKLRLYRMRLSKRFTKSMK